MAALLLTHILQAVYQSLGELNMSKATGGTTTTVVDSILINQSRDNVWKEGTLFIVRDAAGASALPEGQFQRVSAYANSTGTFTVDTAFTTAPAAGDLYGVASAYYPLQQVVRAVNEALTDMGDVDLVDTATLDVDSTKTEYTAAVAWKRARPYRIDVQTFTGTADSQWQKYEDWEWVPAAAGSTGVIIFPDYLYPTGYGIRVWYRDKHPAVNDYSDAIHETFDPETIKIAAKVKALEWQNGRSQGSDEAVLQSLNAAGQALANRKVTNPQWRTKRGPKLMIVGGAGSYDPNDDVAVP